MCVLAIRPRQTQVRPPAHKVVLVDLGKPIGVAFNRDMRVTKVHPGGQAEAAGIMKGAIAVAVAGVKIKNVVDFQLEVSSSARSTCAGSW